jgi:hypothetical protein
MDTNFPIYKWTEIVQAIDKCIKEDCFINVISAPSNEEIAAMPDDFFKGCSVIGSPTRKSDDPDDYLMLWPPGWTVYKSPLDQA